jgi:hypothetical protein
MDLTAHDAPHAVPSVTGIGEISAASRAGGSRACASGWRGMRDVAPFLNGAGRAGALLAVIALFLSTSPHFPTYCAFRSIASGIAPAFLIAMALRMLPLMVLRRVYAQYLGAALSSLARIWARCRSGASIRCGPDESGAPCGRRLVQEAAGGSVNDVDARCSAGRTGRREKQAGEQEVWRPSRM